MERPNKKDYDFNDMFEGVRFASNMIKYADYLEKQLHIPIVVRQSEQLCQHKYQDVRYGTSRCVICGEEEQSF